MGKYWLVAGISLLLLSSTVLAQAEGESLELHDDLEINTQASQGSEDERLSQMSEEEKKQFLEVQQVRTAGCILYTQIFFNTFGTSSIQGIFDKVEKTLHGKLFQKLVSVLIIHCMTTASESDIIQVEQLY